MFAAFSALSLLYGRQRSTILMPSDMRDLFAVNGPAAPGAGLACPTIGHSMMANGHAALAYVLPAAISGMRNCTTPMSRVRASFG